MRFFEMALLAIALGCDAFAVGMGVGVRFCQPRQTFRLSFHFGLFQFIMPVLGWFVSRRLPGTGRVWGPWIAFTLLFLIGAKMVAESLRGKKCRSGECADPTRGLSLLILSVAASLDAFGVGFSLGILGAGLHHPCRMVRSDGGSNDLGVHETGQPALNKIRTLGGSGGGIDPDGVGR